MLQHQQRSLIADFDSPTPLAQAKQRGGTRRVQSKQTLAYGYLRDLLGPEMLDRLLEPVGKYPTARRAAAYQLLRQLSKEDHAMLTIGSMSSSGVKP
jgi:hypothetical protein